MKPLFENVLVEVDKQKELKGGLEVTGGDILTGTVLAVGDGTPDWPVMACQVGDRIRWRRNAGHKIKYKDKDCVILNERNRDIIVKL